MGTKFRTMLAPINAPTGDGRRFASGGITMAPTPFPFEWVRERQGGHDGAVVVGVVQEASIATMADAIKAGWASKDDVKACGLDMGSEAIWGSGEMFDDVDREDMPRLAEDVAEAMTLINAGTLGPSVDLDSFEGAPVKAGTDEEITWSDIEEAEVSGEELKVELLITQGRVRAATLVSIPAFMETSFPMTLETPEVDEKEGDTGHSARTLIASIATVARPDASVFDAPALDGPTPITIDFDSGRVFGHIATWQTCHLGYPDVCVTAPRDDTGQYAWFNRFPVDTGDGGVVWAGRLTVGGRHPQLSLTASATMTQYDGKTVAAHVRATEDEYGIVVSGVLSPDLDESTRRVLARRKVSGDWRETPAGLSLVELLALAPGPVQHAEPGFPVTATHSHNGRQTALTASLGPDPADRLAVPVDVEALAAALEARQEARRVRREAAESLAALITGSARDALAEALNGDQHN